MTLADVDIWQTLLALVGGSSGLAVLLAGIRWAVKKAGASGWECGIWAARVDLAKLRDDAAKGRASTARADAVVKAAEMKVSEFKAVANHACEQCAEVTKERDELALQIAHTAHHAPPMPAAHHKEES